MAVSRAVSGNDALFYEDSWLALLCCVLRAMLGRREM